MVQTRKSKAGSRPLSEAEDEQKPVVQAKRSVSGSSSASLGKRPSSMADSGFDPAAPVRFQEDVQPEQPATVPPELPVEVLKERQVVRQQPRTRSKKTWRGLFGSLGLLYLAATYAFSCHNNPKSDNPVCKAFAAAGETRAEVLDYMHGYAKPHLDRASAYVEPYAAQVRPHYDRATNAAKPYASSAQKAYDQRVHPHVVNAGKQAQAAASPYLDSARAYHSKTVQPQIRHYQKIGQKLHADHIEPNLQKGQAIVQPHIDYAQNVLAPAAQRYYDDVAVPYATKTYSVSRDTYTKQVHPRLTTSWSSLVAFSRAHIFPIFRRWNAVYVQPQVDRVKEKIFEARTKKAAAEAIVEAEVKEKEIAKAEGTEELDAFIEDLRAEIEEPEEPEVIASVTQSVAPTLDPSKEAILKKYVADKRKKLEEERDRYEEEIERLAKTERVLLVQRLKSLRAAAVRDIPARFDARHNDIKHETAKLLAKLEKYFDRVSQDDSGSVEEKIADAELISSKAVTRLANRAQEVQDELEQYSRTHADKESTAVQQAFQAVHMLVGDAQNTLGNGWTWLDGVTVEDWTRYHQLQKREDQIHGEYRDLADGKIKDAQLDSTNEPKKLLTKYVDDVDDLVDGFESTLHKARKAGIKRLRGSVGDSVRAVFESAKSVVGLEEVVPSPPGYTDYVKSAATEASQTAASYASVIASNIPDAAGAAALAHEATRAASRALGATPSPENVQEYAASVLGRASEGVFGEPAASGISASISSAASVASASASSIYQEAIKSMPDLGDVPSSASSLAQQAAASVSSVGQQAASSASSAYNEVSKSASSILPDDLADAPSQASRIFVSVASVASSEVHQATRNVIIAAGGTPLPEGLAEHAESLYARASQNVVGAPPPLASSISSVGVDAASSASSLAQAASSSASSLASAASKSASPLASSASASASSIVSVASASASSLASEASKSAASAASVASASGSSAANVAANSAQSVYEAVSRSVVGTPAASGVSASASSAYSVVSDAASSAIHEGTRAAVRAVGGEPSPEKPAEYVEAATRAVSRRVVSASQTADEAMRAASSAMESAKSAAEKLRERLEL